MTDTTKASARAPENDGSRDAREGMFCRSADIQPNSFNAQSRTFDVIWGTETKVRRFDWYREIPYDEVLSFDPSHLDISTLRSGNAPLLDTHGRYSLDDQIGIVERAGIENGKGTATIRLADVASTAEIFQKLQQGILRNVSVGYRVRKWERMPPTSPDAVEIRKAVDWHPYEVSLVPIPADPAAGVRAHPGPELIEAHRQQEQIMTDAEKAALASAEAEKTRAAEAARVAAEDKARADAEAARLAAGEKIVIVGATRAAIAEVLTPALSLSLLRQGESFGLRADVEKLIEANTAPDVIRSTILEKAAGKQTANANLGGARASITRDERDTLRRSIEAAIFVRANPAALSAAKAEDKIEIDLARAYRGMSLLEMARSYIEDTTGERLRGLGRMELAGLALGLTRDGGGLATTDFPYILANVVNRKLRDAYGQVTQSWKLFCRQSNAPDFKDQARVAMSGLPTFQKVNEGQEYSYAGMSDSQEKYALATYGRIVSISRKAIINDDLGAFNRMPEMIGRAAAELENSTVWGVLTANAAMADTVALFHATHKNLIGSGTLPSVTNIAPMEQLMLEQLDNSGVTPLNLRPMFMVVTPKNKVAAQQILGSIQPTASSAYNPYVNAMQLIVEARLKPASGAEPWYLIGDPGQLDTIEYAYLDGQEGVFTDTRVGFEVDGVEIKGRLDFAAKAIDWRNMVKNVGT